MQKVARRVLLATAAGGYHLCPPTPRASAGRVYLSRRPVNPSAGASHCALHAQHSGEEWCGSVRTAGLLSEGTERWGRNEMGSRREEETEGGEKRGIVLEAIGNDNG